MTITRHGLTVKRRAVVDLLADPANLRTHSPRNIDAIKSSLRAFGQQKPIVINAEGVVLAGNGMLQAAAELGHESIDVVVTELTGDAATAYAIADNRTAELAAWDVDGLVTVLPDLDPELFTATGFDRAELDALLASVTAQTEQPADLDDAVPELREEVITAPGDVWQLGPHRVICGDCRDPAVITRLTGGTPIMVAFTSPPYAEQRAYDPSSGFRPIPPTEYVDWFAPVAANVKSVLAPDGSWFVNIKASATELDNDLYVLDLVIAHARQWGWHFATEYCWERNGMPGWRKRRFKNEFEPIYQFALGEWKFRPEAVRHASDNVPVNGTDNQGQSRRKRKTGSAGYGGGEEQGTNQAPGEYLEAGLAYPGNRLPTFSGSHEGLGHAAAFPVGLPAFFVTAYSDAGDAVLDPFLGSGSTLIAAQQTGRLGFGSELSPAYVDLTCRRWQRLTGIMPRREDGTEVDFA